MEPVCSLDLNPIEHVWDLLQCRVINEPHLPQTLEEQGQTLQRAWQNLDQGLIQGLIASMPNCSQELVCLYRGGYSSHQT